MEKLIKLIDYDIMYFEMELEEKLKHAIWAYETFSDPELIEIIQSTKIQLRQKKIQKIKSKL